MEQGASSLSYPAADVNYNSNSAGDSRADPWISTAVMKSYSFTCAPVPYPEERWLKTGGGGGGMNGMYAVNTMNAMNERMLQQGVHQTFPNISEDPHLNSSIGTSSDV